MDSFMGHEPIKVAKKSIEKKVKHRNNWRRMERRQFNQL